MGEGLEGLQGLRWKLENALEAVKIVEDQGVAAVGVGERFFNLEARLQALEAQAAEGGSPLEPTPGLDSRLAILEKSNLWCEEQIGELFHKVDKVGGGSPEDRSGPAGGEITDAMRRAGAAQILHEAESPALGAARVYRAMCIARSDPS